MSNWWWCQVGGGGWLVGVVLALLGLRLKLALIEVVELLENGFLEQLRVKSSDTVDGVRTDYGQISHPNLLGPSLLNQAHSFDFLVVTWVSLIQLLDVQVVDVIN